MQLLRIQQITEYIPCFTFSPDNRFNYSNAHPHVYSVKSPSWSEVSSGGKNKQQKVKPREGSAVQDLRVDPTAAEMSLGGGGG